MIHTMRKQSSTDLLAKTEKGPKLMNSPKQRCAGKNPKTLKQPNIDLRTAQNR